MTSATSSVDEAAAPSASGAAAGQILLVRRDRGVVTMELNRPARKNGLTADLVEELLRELQAAAGNPEDRAVVLTGAGGAFCSGMDLAESPRPDELTFM